jgi:hypothetical protein
VLAATLGSRELGAKSSELATAFPSWSKPARRGGWRPWRGEFVHRRTRSSERGASKLGSVLIAVVAWTLSLDLKRLRQVASS